MHYGNGIYGGMTIDDGKLIDGDMLVDDGKLITVTVMMAGWMTADVREIAQK